MTSDHLRRIYALETSLVTPIGYKGRGITTGRTFGETVAVLMTAMGCAGLLLPMTDLGVASSAPIMSRVEQSALTANQILKVI